MEIIVFLKMVPDVVEELVIAEDGRSLDTQILRMKLNDPDDHALEEALILKEKYGGTVTVVALEAPEIDEVLFTAIAKGADKAIKIPVDWTGIQSLAISKLFADFLNSTSRQLNTETLLLIGSQAIDDLQGEVAPYFAETLKIPYMGVVTGINLDDSKKKVIVLKEFAGGMRGEFELPLPAILGIQAAEKPPRYVPVAKVRAVMKSAKIETIDIPPPDALTSLSVEKLLIPEVAGKAKMIEGTPEDVAKKIVDLLIGSGIIRG